MVAEDNGRFPVSDFGGFGFGDRAVIGGNGGVFMVVMDLANV